MLCPLHATAVRGCEGNTVTVPTTSTKESNAKMAAFFNSPPSADAAGKVSFVPSVAVGVCSGDANVVVASWEEAALTESARAATQIAFSRMISLQAFDCVRNVAVGS